MVNKPGESYGLEFPFHVVSGGTEGIGEPGNWYVVDMRRWPEEGNKAIEATFNTENIMLWDGFAQHEARKTCLRLNGNPQPDLEAIDTTP